MSNITRKDGPAKVTFYDEEDEFFVWKPKITGPPAKVTFYDDEEEKTTPKPIECTCGAKHTSNPNYHMWYCDSKR